MNPLDVVALTPLMEYTSGRREIVIGLLDGPVAMTHPDLVRSEEHTSELQSRGHLVCRLLLEKKTSKPSSSRPTSRRCGCGRCFDVSRNACTRSITPLSCVSRPTKSSTKSSAGQES